MAPYEIFSTADLTGYDPAVAIKRIAGKDALLSAMFTGVPPKRACRACPVALGELVAIADDQQPLSDRTAEERKSIILRAIEVYLGTGDEPIDPTSMPPFVDKTDFNSGAQFDALGLPIAPKEVGHES